MDRNYECPICYKTLLPPVYQCHHGHLLCNLCEGQVDQCPICRVQLCPQKIRNLAVEGIIKEMGFLCENRSLGCSQAHLSWDQVDNHYIDCPFTKKLYCKSLGLNCDEEHDSRGIIPHITLVHKFKGRINNLDLDLDCDKGLEIGSSQSQGSIEDVNNEFGHGSGGLLSTTTLESTCTTMTPTGNPAPAPTMNSHLDIHYQCKSADLDKYLRHCTNVFFIKFQSKLFFVKKHFNLNSKTLSFLILMDGSQAASDQFSVTVNIHPEHSKTPSLEWHQQIYLLSSGLNAVDNNRTLDENSFADSQNQNQIKIKIPTMLIEQIGKVKHSHQTGTDCCNTTLNWKIKFVFTKLKTQQNSGSGCSVDQSAAAGLTKNPKLSKHKKVTTTTATTEIETLPNQMSRSRRLFRSNLDPGHQGHQDGNNNMTLPGSMDQGQQRHGPGPGHNTQTQQNQSHNNYFSGTSSTFSALVSWVRERILANRI